MVFCMIDFDAKVCVMDKIVFVLLCDTSYFCNRYGQFSYHEKKISAILLFMLVVVYDELL